MTTAELAQRIMDRQRGERLALHNRPWQPSATPATSLGYACERRIVYQRCWSDKASPIGDELASIFEEGNLHQRDVRQEMARLGWEVVESEVNFRDDRLEITGTIDGKIEVPDETARKGFRRVPLEIKSTAASAPVDEAAWRNSESSLLRRYYAQLQIYLYLTSEPDGLALFKSKQTGLWVVVAVSLDYEYVEGLLRRAERVRDAVARIKAAGVDEAARVAQLPDRLADRSECDGCPFRDTICHPAEAAVDPLLLAEDPELAAQLDERAELDADATRYDKLDKRIKARFQLTSGDRFVVGSRWLVSKRKHGNDIRIKIQRLASGEAEAA